MLSLLLLDVVMILLLFNLRFGLRRWTGIVKDVILVHKDQVNLFKGFATSLKLSLAF